MRICAEKVGKTIKCYSHCTYCPAVPDISVDGCLSVTHIMLDKRQLELVKGLLDMNLGEDIEEFEKPSTLIHDPVLQVQQCVQTC